jgi:uncharacterized protein (DUF2236 family)
MLVADTVSAEDLERSLIWAKAQAPSPTAGLFGPDSMTWRIDREAILFLAAGHALLMQLAHPWVAQGVADHSFSLDDPIGRFHRTFSAMFNFVFGTVDQALDAARRLHRRHEAIRGVLQHPAGPFAAGSPYAANHLPALRWVLLTLTDGSIAAYEAVLPPLTASERDRYVAERRILGAMFGIPPDSLPQDWSAFETERDRRLASAELTVTAPAICISERLVVNPPLRLIPDWFSTITARLLPGRLRMEYGLVYGREEQRSAERALRWIKRAYPKLPPYLRYVGPYHEARGRLRGRSRPTPVTRALNRIWIGSAALPGPRLKKTP